MESIYNLMQLKAVRGQSVIDGTESTSHLGRIQGCRCMIVVLLFHAVVVTVAVTGDAAGCAVERVEGSGQGERR